MAASALQRDPGAGGAVVLRRHGSTPATTSSTCFPPGSSASIPRPGRASTSRWGLLTRYRRSLTPLRTNLSTGVDLEYSPGSRLETEIVPHRAGLVFTDYTTGETQYDYDVSFYQVAPYAQADVALPGRVQPERRRPLRPPRLRLHQPAQRRGHRVAPPSRFHRCELRSPEPEAGRHVGGGAQRERLRLLPRGIPRPVGEPALPPGRGGEHGGPQAGARLQLGWRCPGGAGRHRHPRGHGLQHAAQGRHPHLLRSRDRPPSHPERRRHQSPGRRSRGSALAWWKV